MIHTRQDEYYVALSNDLDYFVDFMLEIIETTLEKYIDDSSYRANWLVEDLTTTEYQVLNTVMKYLDKNDFITTEIATKLVKKSSSTTRRYMAKYSELGISESIGSNKGRIYF